MNRIKVTLIRLYTVLISLCMSTVFKINAFATATEAPTISPKTETQAMPSVGTNGGAEEELKNFLVGDNGFMNLVSQAGMILIAFGTGQLILAFKDDNPDAKLRGTMILLGGVFCVTLSGILRNLGVDM